MKQGDLSGRGGRGGGKGRKGRREREDGEEENGGRGGGEGRKGRKGEEVRGGKEWGLGRRERKCLERMKTLSFEGEVSKNVDRILRTSLRHLFESIQSLRRKVGADNLCGDILCDTIVILPGIITNFMKPFDPIVILLKSSLSPPIPFLLYSTPSILVDVHHPQHRALLLPSHEPTCIPVSFRCSLPRRITSASESFFPLAPSPSAAASAGFEAFGPSLAVLLVSEVGISTSNFIPPFFCWTSDKSLSARSSSFPLTRSRSPPLPLLA
eukprot:758381-Hanusia_phi.AAC.2